MRKYGQIATDFNVFDPVGFFDLGSQVRHRPRKLGKRKRWHRWGFLVLLFKEKRLKRIRSGDPDLYWECLRWRPLVSAYNNVWKGWYSLGGKTLSLLARVIFSLGDTVTSTREIQTKILTFNESLGHRDVRNLT